MKPVARPDVVSTRVRILDAAEGLFAARGFRATSVRQITLRAACNLASISYHFGGKERLYEEVVLRRLCELRRLRMEAIRSALDAAGGQATPELLIRAFATAFVEPLGDRGSARTWLQMVSHEMLDPRLPCETFEREIVVPVQGALALAMRRVCPGLSRRDGLLCAHSLVAQLVHAVQLERFFRRSRNRRLTSDFALPRMVEHVVWFTAAALRAMARGGRSRGGRGRRMTRVAVAIAAACLIPLGAGARTIDPVPPAAPSVPWVPPEAPRSAALAPRRPAELPPEILHGGPTITLDQVVDITLQNNPATRETWAAARAAAQRLRSKRAAYYPELGLTADASRQSQTAVGGQFSYRQTTYGPAVDLELALFDFGGRRADVDEAREALRAANFAHNRALQDVVLGAEEAYYRYLAAQGVREARQADVETAETALAAAEARHRAGVATIADVLQARTARSRVHLALVRVEGEMNAIKGELATAMGWSPDVAVDIGRLPESVPFDRVVDGIGVLLEQAVAERPELAEARALAAAARSHAASVRAEGLPRLDLSAEADRVFYTGTQGPPFSDNWRGLLMLRVPLFAGGRHRADRREAEALADAAGARAEALDRVVRLDVWTRWYDLQTAAQQIAESRDLLASARQNTDVAQERYASGVGGILDLLAAQSALTEARAEEIGARASWFLAFAGLAWASGTLAPPAPPAPLASPAVEPAR